ncbi:MAG: SIS domain-containing protein [Candidatus Woesebacteria bacterium]
MKKQSSKKINKSILDSRQAIAKIDKSNVLGSVEALADQIKHIWEIADQSLSFKSKNEIENVVVTGMGGSALGPDVVKYLFKEKLDLPFEVVNSYTLPNYVNQHSLVILSSYSGTTEEVLACSKEVEKKNAQVMVITAGGELKKIAEKKSYPLLLIDPKYNPCGEPRMAIGYAIFGMIALLSKAGIIQISEDETKEVITTIISVIEKCKVEVEAEKNQAKTLAFALYDKRPIFVASEFLTGAAHVAANQSNENAKAFADYKIIPEINHHLMEGLHFPKSNTYSHLFIFFNSSLYNPRNQKRMKLTQRVVEKNQIETLSIKLESESKITQVFELITLTAYSIFYLSMLENVNPDAIPYVDWFKAQMKK